MKIINTIKKFFASRRIRKELIEEFDKLDSTKWFYPKTTAKEMRLRGLLCIKKDKWGNAIKGKTGAYILEDDDAEVENIFIRSHPDSSVDWHDGFFWAGPVGFDFQQLTNGDRRRLLEHVRRGWGY